MPEAVVIPIILRPVDWNGAPFAKVQCLPTDGRPVTSWPNRDEAFRNVAEGIRRAIVKAATASGAEVQERALDAAIPSGVAVGRSTEMLTQIRRIASEGLKAVLRVEETHDTSGRDVQSRPFRMEFLLDAAGRFQPRVLSVRVESNDFDVAERVKQLWVPPDGDSEPCAFLVTARRAGELALIVEVLHEGISVASRMLRTKGEAAAQTAAAGTYLLASLPLTTYGFGAAVMATRDPRLRYPWPSAREISLRHSGTTLHTHLRVRNNPRLNRRPFHRRRQRLSTRRPAAVCGYSSLWCWLRWP